MDVIVIVPFQVFFITSQNLAQQFLCVEIYGSELYCPMQWTLATCDYLN